MILHELGILLVHVCEGGTGDRPPPLERHVLRGGELAATREYNQYYKRRPDHFLPLIDSDLLPSAVSRLKGVRSGADTFSGSKGKRHPGFPRWRSRVRTEG